MLEDAGLTHVPEMVPNRQVRKVIVFPQIKSCITARDLILNPTSYGQGLNRVRYGDNISALMFIYKIIYLIIDLKFNFPKQIIQLYFFHFKKDKILQST